MRLAAILLFTIFVMTGSVLSAAEEAAAPAKPEAPAKAEDKPVASASEGKDAPTPQKSPAADAKAVETDTAAAAKDSTNKGPSPQRFIPSEQVRADFDVSFPIDI